jgi:hypothetical protein
MNENNRRGVSVVNAPGGIDLSGIELLRAQIPNLILPAAAKMPELAHWIWADSKADPLQ